MQEKIIILDFGSQYTQLIARRLRELNTYCEILPYNKFPYGEEGIKGVILSGSPYSVNDPFCRFESYPWCLSGTWRLLRGAIFGSYVGGKGRVCRYPGIWSCQFGLA